MYIVRYTYVHVYLRVCVSVFMTSASVWGILYRMLISLISLGTLCIYVYMYVTHMYMCMCVCV